MNTKKINDFFGYSLYFVGAAKVILIILAFLKFGSDVSNIVNQNEVTSSDIISLCSGLIGIAQIVLAIASIIMIFVNTTREPKVIKGYLYALGAILIELFVPSFLMIFFIFVECSIYMKAGSIIVKSGSGDTKSNKRNEELAKNTEWFFDEEREANRINRVEEKKEENINTQEEKNENFKGISISNILIVWIVIIALILVVYLINDMKTDNKKEENTINTVVPNNIINILSNTTSNTISNTTSTNTSKDRIPKSDGVIESSLDEVEETDERLIKIANAFNNSETASGMIKEGYVLTAIASGNQIMVYGSGAGININITYTLNGDILSTEVVEHETDSRISLLRILHAMILLDSVGQFKGYPERTITNAFNDEKSKYYTVENEGVELKEDTTTGNIIIKADLSKDFSFLNSN